MKISKASLVTSRVLFSMLICAIGLLFSCGDDEAPKADPPSIFFMVEGGTVNADMNEVSAQSGTILLWDFTITAPGGFNTFRIEGLATTLEITRTDLQLEAGTMTALVSDVPTALVGEGNLELAFIAVDDAGSSTTANVTVMISSTPTNNFTGRMVAPPLGDVAGTPEDERVSNTWFSGNLGESTSSASIIDGTSSSADVDFGYYFLNGMANLAAPESFPSAIYDLSSSGQNWTTVNTTTFRSTDLSESNFLEISTAAQVDEIYENGEDTNDDGLIRDIKVGDVIGFQTDVDKDGGSFRGIIIIKSITEGDGSLGEMIFDAKIQ